MARGRYKVTRLGEEDTPQRAGPCSRPACRLLLVMLVLLVLAVAATVGVVLYQRAQHRSSVYTIYTVDESRLYRGGSDITEGDMLGLNTSSGERGGTMDSRRLWPLGQVLYRADPAIGCPQSARCEVLLAAVEEYSSRTCVQWIQREDSQQAVLQIQYRPDSGCFAHVGYRGSDDTSQPQLVVLGNGCFNEGILLHLLGHTLGMWHEHNRPDRDSWLNINMTNVDQQHIDSFRKFRLRQHHIVDRLDYSSVMMFGGDAFSSGSGPTMRSHWSGGPLRELWQKTQLSEQDVHRVQAMYIKECSRRDRQAQVT